MFNMCQSTMRFLWCQSSHSVTTWGQMCVTAPWWAISPKTLIYSSIKKITIQMELIFFSFPRYRNCSLNICQANCFSKCSWFSPLSRLADYLTRTSVFFFFLPWFLLRIHRVTPNLENAKFQRAGGFHFSLLLHTEVGWRSHSSYFQDPEYNPVHKVSPLLICLRWQRAAGKIRGTTSLLKDSSQHLEPAGIEILQIPIHEFIWCIYKTQ